MTNPARIGVFDSGVGGLTVLHSLRDMLPNERFVYLGDTARVPYGTKSPATVALYATNVASLLLERGCKALVIACNTASAYGLDAVKALTEVPVLDVIEPVASAVARASTGGRIGVLGTRGTVGSDAYGRALRDRREGLHVVHQPCPLLVPLAEEGWTEGDVPDRVLDTYLAKMLREERLDSLILGCTHYPLLRSAIEGAIRRHSLTPVAIHETGEHTARRLIGALDAAGLDAPEAAAGPESAADRVEYLVTDDPIAFRAVGARFLGHEVARAEHVVVT